MVLTRSRTRRRTRSLQFGLSLLTLGTSVALAGAGDLDPTFGAGGRAFFNIVNVVEASTAIAQQSDGKLLVGRWVYYWQSTEDLSVVRYLADGTPDPSFSGDGRTGINLGVMEGATRAVLALSDGRIVAAGHVAGYEDTTASQIGIARYLSNGAVDTSFGNNGAVTGNFGATFASIQALVEQADGRLVGGGFLTAPGQPQQRDLLIVRMNVDGSLDSTFGDAGKRVIDFSAAARDDAIQALALQADGKIMVAGQTIASSGARHVAVVRLLSGGQLDATFGTGGRAEIPLSGNTSWARVALRLQSDGKILLAAQDNDPDLEECTAVVARLHADGSPDLGFGTSGVAEGPLGACYFAGGSALAIEPGGAIVVANAASTTPGVKFPRDVRVDRLNAAGEPDGTFGVDGTTIVDMGSEFWPSNVYQDVTVAMVLQSDGRIALTASDQFDWEGGGDFFVVARLRASGDSAGLLSFVDSYTTIDERAGTMSVRVRRTGGVTGVVSVDYTPVVQSASGARNFTGGNGTLTWTDGDASEKTITLGIVDDARFEGDEYVDLVLESPTGGAQLGTRRTYVYIGDNEPQPAGPPAPGGPPVNSGGGGGALGWLTGLALAAALTRRRKTS